MGKKILLAIMLTGAFACGVMAQENAGETSIEPKGLSGRPFWKQFARDVLLYIPNRIFDISDLISIRAGAGAPFAVNVKATNLMQFGGNHGPYYFLEKGYNRQCGGGACEGGSFGMLMLDYLDLNVSDTFGYTDEYSLSKGFGVSNCDLAPYVDNKVDFWAIGAEAGFVISFGVNVHLRELPDLVAGIFFFDLSGDDLK